MRIALAVILFFAAAVFFEHPAARVIVVLAGLFAFGEGIAARCPLLARLGGARHYLIGVTAIQFVLAYEWWSAGLEKLANSEFVGGMAGTLGYFASKNPFPWYKDFLLGFASQNATAFAYTVEWSQVIIALILAVTAGIIVYTKGESTNRWVLVLVSLALLGGMLMNANFYLAAGWTGPGTHGINVVMFWTQAILFYVWTSRLASRSS